MRINYANSDIRHQYYISAVEAQTSLARNVPSGEERAETAPQAMWYFHISLHFISLEPYSRLWTDLWTTFHILWLAIGQPPNPTQTPPPAPPPPPPGKTLVIREPYQSPEHAFDSFLKDDLPDQNKNVEKCKQQSKDFKSSSSLWKKDSTLSFVYIALSLSLSLPGLHGSKVFTRGYMGS